jgi:hypothetical protein
MEDELDMETQLEREFAAEQEELLEVEEEEEEEDDDEDEDAVKKKEKEIFDEKSEKEQELDQEGSDEFSRARAGLSKVRSLPSNFTYNPPADTEKTTDGKLHHTVNSFLSLHRSNSLLQLSMLYLLDLLYTNRNYNF